MSTTLNNFGEIFRSDFKLQLEKLKNNNRQIIKLLTHSAEVNKEHAAQIVELIVNVESPDGLSIFNLMHSIMVNVGGQYVAFFSCAMVKTFSAKFRGSVDSMTRKKMYDLRHIWDQSCIC